MLDKHRSIHRYHPIYDVYLPLDIILSFIHELDEHETWHTEREGEMSQLTDT